MFGIDKAIEAISSAPVMNAVLIAIVIMAGLVARYYGKREQRAVQNVEFPMFLLSGPAAGAINGIHQLVELQRQQVALLERLVNQMEAMDHQREVTQNLLREMRPSGRGR